MDELRISTDQGMVPLSNFVRMEPAPGVDALKRIDGRPVELIRANVRDGVMADSVVADIEAWIARESFDPAIDIRFRGANEEQADSMAFVSAAFGLALAIMFLLLVSQFNNFYQSVLILLAVVMSTAGVLLGLLISQAVFSTILTGVGIVALAGIVVNNNIVLIDTYNHLRRSDSGLSAAEAVYKAAQSRFRPVMLTSITTIVGLLPLANGLSIDLVNRSYSIGGMVASWWQPLASAIVNGLVVSTVLTLLLTPAMLLLPGILAKYLGFKVIESQFEHDGAD